MEMEPVEVNRPPEQASPPPPEPASSPPPAPLPPEPPSPAPVPADSGQNVDLFA
jgi:hypothetical protein